jgi:hypothetical protein
MRTRIGLALLLLMGMSACGQEGGSETTPSPTAFRAIERSPEPTPEATEEPSPTPTSTPDESTTPAPEPTERCRNSTDPDCGKFRFDPSVDDDAKTTVKVAITPPNPKPDELVKFRIVAVDDDSQELFLGTYSFSSEGPGVIADDFHGTCPKAYGAWDPPDEKEGTLGKTISHRYREAGTYTATFQVISHSYGEKHPWPDEPPGDGNGSCIDPLAGAGTAKITFRVENPPTPTPSA